MNELFDSVPTALLLVPFLCFFLAMWFGITVLLSQVGGWKVLAGHYQYSGEFPQTKKKFRRVIVRRNRFLATTYGGIVTIGVDDEALYVKMSWIFKFAHMPLRIPLSEISVEQYTVLRQHHTVLNFVDKTHVQIVMFSGNWDWVLENAPVDGII